MCVVTSKTSTIERTKKAKSGNAKVKIQGRRSRCQENNYKNGIDTTQKYHEQESRSLTTSTTNTYTQQYMTAWVRGTILTQQKETTDKKEKEGKGKKVTHRHK